MSPISWGSRKSYIYIFIYLFISLFIYSSFYLFTYLFFKFLSSFLKVVQAYSFYQAFRYFSCFIPSVWALLYCTHCGKSLAEDSCCISEENQWINQFPETSVDLSNTKPNTNIRTAYIRYIISAMSLLTKICMLCYSWRLLPHNIRKVASTSLITAEFHEFYILIYYS